MYISQQDFEQLKRYFDLNQTYEGANFLANLIERVHTDRIDPPFNAGKGLMWNQDPASLRPTLEWVPIDTNTGVGSNINQLKTEVTFLRAAVAELQKMHTEGGDHIPPIISTKEQAEALKDKISKEERVLIHTTFDKALRAFE